MCLFLVIVEFIVFNFYDVTIDTTIRIILFNFVWIFNLVIYILFKNMGFTNLNIFTKTNIILLQQGIF